jgi:hypothetical protein
MLLMWQEETVPLQTLKVLYYLLLAHRVGSDGVWTLVEFRFCAVEPNLSVGGVYDAVAFCVAFVVWRLGCSFLTLNRPSFLKSPKSPKGQKVVTLVVSVVHLVPLQVADVEYRPFLADPNQGEAQLASKSLEQPENEDANEPLRKLAKSVTVFVRGHQTVLSFLVLHSVH